MYLRLFWFVENELINEMRSELHIEANLFYNEFITKQLKTYNIISIPKKLQTIKNK